MEEFHSRKANQRKPADADHVFELKDQEAVGNVERRKWIATLLEDHKRAVEESEKSYAREQEHLRNLHTRFYEILIEETSFKEKAKPTHSHADSINLGLSENHLVHIQALQEKINQAGHEINRLKGGELKLIKDVQSLIEDSTKLFARHRDQLEMLLTRLGTEPTVNKIHLRQYQILFENADEKIKKLKEECAKTEPDFELCHSYVIDVGNFYQVCYGSMITLIKQQPTLGDIQFSGEIELDGIVKAGGNVYGGHGITVNQICQKSSNALKDILQETQKKFEEIETQHNALQQNYKKTKEELAVSQENLIRQQEDLSKRLQAEKIAAEKHAAEQAEKEATVKQEIENSNAEAGQARNQMEAMLQRIQQLETSIKEEQAKQATTGIHEAEPSPPSDERKQGDDQEVKFEHGINSKNLPSEQNLSEEERKKYAKLKSILPESQYDEHRALATALKEIGSRDKLVQQTTWQTLVILARNAYLSKQEVDQLFAVATSRSREDLVAAQQILAALASNSHLSDAQVAEMLATTIAMLDFQETKVQAAAEETLAALIRNSRLFELQIAQLFTTGRRDILIILAGNLCLSELQIVQILDYMVVRLQCENWGDGKDIQQILIALASTTRLSSQQVARMLAAIIAGLNNKYNNQEAAQKILITLASTAHLSEQQIIQIFIATTHRLKDKQWYVQKSAWENLTALLDNSLFSEQQVTQLFTDAITNQDQDWRVQKAVREALVVLRNNSRLSEQQNTQLFMTAVDNLKNQNCHVQEAAWQILTALIDNLPASEKQITELLATAIATLEDRKDEKKDIRRFAYQILITLAANPHISEKQITQIFMASKAAYWWKLEYVRRPDQKIRTALVKNPRTSDQLVTQIFSDAIIIATNNLNDQDVSTAAQETLTALASNLHSSDQQISKIFVTVIASLQGNSRSHINSVQETLTALLDNSRLSEQQITELLNTAIASLKNQSWFQTAEKTLINLSNNSHLLEPQITQIFSAAIVSVKDKNENIQSVAWQMLTVLTSNPRLSGPQITQVYDTTVVSLLNENGGVRYAIQETLIALASIKRFSDEQIAQILVAATNSLEDEYSDIRKSAQQTLVALIGNPYLSGQQTAQVLTAIIVNSKGEIYSILSASQQILAVLTNTNFSDQQISEIIISHADLQYTTLTILIALISNSHLSEQQATLICSAIISRLKVERVRESIKYNLIEQVKDGSLDQLPKYIPLANTLMQDADIYIQLTAISMLATIHDRYQNTFKSDLADATQPEEKQQSPQSSSAEAAAARGFMPKPREGAGNNSAQAAAAPATQFRR
jgi:hypothetical protein